MENVDSITREDLAAGLDFVVAVAETVKELEEVPSGTLYAVLSSVHGMTLDEYNKITSLLVKWGMIKEENNIISWVK